MTILAELIDEGMGDLDISISELARRTELSKSTICEILSGKNTNISAKTAFKLSSALDISCRDICEASMLDGCID
jgi:plasmid maintenance system antidote protein VapI